MPRYLVLWSANASNWPGDPKQSLALIEATVAGGDMLLQSGALKELGWFTPQSGYGIFEAANKAAVLGMVQPFFPAFSQEIREIVPWADGKQAVLASARQVAG